MANKWPTQEQMQKMDTAQISALANALGVGRWVMDESRPFIEECLWAKIERRRTQES